MDWDAFSHYLWQGGDMQYLWFAAIIIGCYISYKLYLVGKNPDLLNPTKKLYYGYAFFFFSYAITRVFFLCTDFYSENDDEENNEFIVMIKCAYISSLLGFVFYMYVLESNFINTKGRLSKIVMLIIIIILFFPYTVFSYIAYALIPICFTFVLAMYLRILKNTKGELRNKIRGTTLFIFLFFVGLMMDTRVMRDFTTIHDIKFFAYQLPPIWVSLSMLGLKRDIPYIDPSQWLYHFWIMDNKSSICLFEMGFKKINIDAGLITSFMSAMKTFGKQITQSDLRGIIFTDYLFVFRKFKNFSIILASNIQSVVSEIEYFVEDISLNFSEIFAEKVKDFEGNTGQFAIYGMEIEKLLKKKPLNLRILETD